MARLLQTIARNLTGELVYAADAEKGGAFFCGLCKDELILRKSGKTGPGTKRPHFAHKPLSPNCSPESVLHFEFKTMLAAEIETRIEAGADLPVSWQCTYCYSEHSGNLLKKAKRVSLEHSFGSCRADLALIDEDDRAVAALEVVVTHAPEDTVKTYYRLNGIVLIELRLGSDDVLSDVAAELQKADTVQLCTSGPRCRKCGHFKQPVEMMMINTRCYICNSKMKVPFIEGDDSRGGGPDEFSQKEISIARRHGAVIEWQYSRTLNTKYWAATCGDCGKFIGRHYLFTEYVAPGEVVERILLGHFCVNCEIATLETGQIEPWRWG